MPFRNTLLSDRQTSEKRLSNLMVMAMGEFQERNSEWYVNNNTVISFFLFVFVMVFVQGITVQCYLTRLCCI